MLTPTRAAMAAGLLAAKDPAAALSAYERGHMEQNGKSIASGRVRPLADAGLKPLEDIPADIERKLTANHRLMASLGLQPTPPTAWRYANAAVHIPPRYALGLIAVSRGPCRRGRPLAPRVQVYLVGPPGVADGEVEVAVAIHIPPRYALSGDGVI